MGEPGHVSRHCEAEVTKRILLLEDGGVLNLLTEPFDVFGISQCIVCPAEESQWDLDVSKLVVRRSGLVVLLHVDLLAMIISCEMRFAIVRAILLAIVLQVEDS